MKTRSAKAKEKTFSDLDEDTLYVVAEMVSRKRLVGLLSSCLY